MAQGRPAIPTAVERQVMREAGHRCAICGEQVSLQLAHIVPWADSHDHSAGNLIYLCANCHGRADQEPAKKWGTETLLWYKANPWVHHRGRRRPGDEQPAALHTLPFLSIGSLLKGRDALLDSLGAGSGGEAKAQAIVQPQTFSGLGGIGKTRLAVEYGWRCVAQGRTVLFVAAESGERLMAGIAGLADALELPERQLAEQEEVSAAVIRWLRSNPGWLLIIDGADSDEAAAAVMALLPRLEQGEVVVSSRLTRWPASIRRHLLDTLEPPDAVAFLLERTGDDRNRQDDDEALAENLAELLGGLPLALEQAAAYINHRHLSLAGYLAEWEREREGVLRWFDRAVMEGYDYPVAVTWQTTFERLTPLARTVLRLLAQLAPEPIPFSLLEADAEVTAAAVTGLRVELGLEETETDLRDAVAELDTYSLVQHRGDELRVHRLVQEVVRIHIEQGHRRQWQEWALRLVTAAYPDKPIDVRNWPVCEQLHPHAVVIAAAADALEISYPTTILMNQAGQYLHGRCLFDQAEPLMRRALEIGEASYGPQHPNVAASLNDLAQLLKATNRLTEAEPLMRRALEIVEESYGPQHPRVAIVLNNLATLLKATDRLAEAESLMRRALEIDEASYGPQHPDVAIDLNNLAQLLQVTNRLGEAEPLMHRALEILTNSLVPGHPQRATVQRNLDQLLEQIAKKDHT